MNRLPRAALGISAVLLTAGVLTGCGTADTKPVADTQPSVQATAGADSTYLVECVQGNNVQQPKTFTLACGDGNEQLQDLKWTNWGKATATATGSITMNSCEPDCANGKPWAYDVRVTAKDLVITDGKQAYTMLVVDAASEHPVGTPEHEELRQFDLSGNMPDGKNVIENRPDDYQPLPESER